MPNRNHLYKKVLHTAPFGTVFFSYGVCIDASAQALSILQCERWQIIGTAIGEDQDHQPESIQQFKQVIKKLQDDQLEGILWRSENILEQDEIVVSSGALEDAEEVLCLILYPLPSLAKMVVEEFSTTDLATVETSIKAPLSAEALPGKVPEKLKTPPSLEANARPRETEEPVYEASTADQREPEVLDNHSKLAASIKGDQYETLAGLPVSPRLIESISNYLNASQEDSPCGTLLLI
ncbi:MAG: hypothetical protein ACPGF6_02535, partial [Porticoccaceae bacterium]